MTFDDVLKSVNRAFKIRKPVDFDEFDLHLILEILDTVQEIKVLESLKDFESSQYVEGLKRHTLAYAIMKLNDIDLDVDDVNIDEGGQKVSKSKFLFMRDYLAKWPSSLVDAVFDAYTNMQVEVEKRLSNGMKFQRFQMEDAPKAETKGPEFQPVTEDESDEDLTDAEKLAKQVEKEQEQVQAARANVQETAEARLAK